MKRIVLRIGFLVAAHAACGQTTGRIVGTVKDPSGALVAGAVVECTLSTYGESRKVLTDSAGGYTAPLLAPGDYQVTFSAKGFATRTFEHVTVALTETTVVDAELSLAAETTAVTVSATPLLQTTGPQLGRVVDSRAVSELPLATRNFTQILGLSPGAATYLPDNTGVGRNTQTISVNGARVTQNSLQLNGVDVTTMGTAGVILVGVPAPPESVQEFKVQTSLYDASFGRAGGGNVQMVTRSGSNDFHGGAYEYFRNEALNANNPFLKAANLPRPVLKRQVFGGTAGGHIRRDRTFYFLSYQGTRERNGASPLNSLSSGVLIDPRLTADRSAPTLARIFSVSSVDPIALALLNARLPNGQLVIPTPQPNGHYSGSAISAYVEDQFNTNFDHRVSGKNWLSARFFFANQPSTIALPTLKGSGANVPGFGTEQRLNNRVLVLQDVHAFSPGLFNEVRAGYTFNRNYVAPQEPIRDSDLGIRRADAASFPGLGLIRIAPSSGGIVMGSSSVAPVVAFVATLADTVSITHGPHAIRAGEEIRWNGVNTRASNQTRGQIDFASFPAFLAGNATSSTFGSGIFNRNQRAVDYNFFVQDDWRVSPKMTLNLGLRYELDLPPYETRGVLATFDPSLYHPALNGGPIGGFVGAGNALPQYRLPSLLRAEKGLVPADTTDFAPRVGFAWSPAAAGHIVVRGGAGVFHSRASFNYASANSSTPPFYILGTRMSPPFADPFFAVPPPASFPTFVSGINLSGSYFDRNIRTPVFYQFNMSLQYKLGQDLVLEAAYVGTRGLNLFRQVAINQARLASPTSPEVDQATGALITTNTPGNAPQRAPFLGANINSFFQNQSTAQSSYHSLQTSLTKRFSRGLEFLLSYTFSKSIDNGSGAGGGAGTSGVINPNAPADTGVILGNQLDNRANRGVSDFDRTHRLVGSWLWDIPKARVARPLLNDWKISGIVTAMSGLPVDIVDSGAGEFYGLARGGSALARPGVVMQPSPAPSGYFFNPFAFARPVIQAGQPIPSSGGTAIAGATGSDIGNVGRNILRGPHQANVDLAVARRFPLQETKAIEVRAEFFNAFNWVNYANPLSDFNGIMASGGSIDSFGRVVNPGDFGRIIAASSNPRIIQFTLKLNF
jgi:Carboxypeptidase regulatory-like domain/TonB dependent receptor